MTTRKIHIETITLYTEFLTAVLDNFNEGSPLSMLELIKMHNVSNATSTVLLNEKLIKREGRKVTPLFTKAEPIIARKLVLGIRKYRGKHQKTYIDKICQVKTQETKPVKTQEDHFLILLKNRKKEIQKELSKIDIMIEFFHEFNTPKTA